MSVGSSRDRVGHDRPAQKTHESSGASSKKTGFADRFASYLLHHKSSFDTTLARLLEAKSQTLLTAMVVAIALALPTLLLLALNNVQGLGETWDTDPKLTVYLHERAKPNAIEALIAELNADPRISASRYMSADEALAEFELLSGFGSALSGLDSNPLPASIEISLSAEANNTQVLTALVAELNERVLVDDAVVDLQWVQRFLSLTALARQIVLFLALLLGVGAVLAIGNTVRLIIENRKDEIVIIKLVGGTNGFVRRPLLYTGGLYGLFGAMLALIFLQAALLLVAPTVRDIAESYQTKFVLEGLTGAQILQLILVGTAMGWLGAILAIGRHLAAIEPR